MADTYATVDIKGNVVRDPVLSKTANSKTFTHVTIATNYRYESPAGSKNYKEETTYYTVELWGDNAERTVARVHKGQYAGAVGFLSMTQFTGRDNKQHYSLLVRNCTKVWDLTRNPPRAAASDDAGAQPAGQTTAGPSEAQAPPPGDTDISPSGDLDETPF
jgi:single-stranded DNA-binding protein